jgi:hypothetical protein
MITLSLLLFHVIRRRTNFFPLCPTYEKNFRVNFRKLLSVLGIHVFSNQWFPSPKHGTVLTFVLLFSNYSKCGIASARNVEICCMFSYIVQTSAKSKKSIEVFSKCFAVSYLLRLVELELISSAVKPISHKLVFRERCRRLHEVLEIGVNSDYFDRAFYIFIKFYIAVYQYRRKKEYGREGFFSSKT